MAGPYLIGIDGGTQSSKVVDLRRGRATSSRRPASAAADEPARATASPSTPTTTSGTRSPPRAVAALAGFPDARRDRRRRSLHDPLLQGVPPRGRLAGGARPQLDGRPRLPALPARRPRARLRDDLARATSPTASPASCSDTAANNILLQWPIDTDAWQWSDDAALYETFGVTREMLVRAPAARRHGGAGDSGGRRGDRASPPGLPVVADRERQGRRGARRGLARRATALISLGTYIAGWCPARENRTGPDRVLDELRLRPAPLPLREPRHPPRDVDAELVPRPPRRRVRRARRASLGLSREQLHRARGGDGSRREATG